MAEVVPLKYGVVFKKAFGKPEIFCKFVEDVLGVRIHMDKVHQEYEYKDCIGRVKIKYDLFAEDVEQRIIVEIQNIREYDFNDRFLYYHLISLVEQVKGYEEYSIPKAVYTIVVLTTNPRDKSVFYSAAVSDMDPVVLDRSRHGQKLSIYRHKLVFLNPRLVSEDTPEGVKPWLDLIKDSLDGQMDEAQYSRPEFRDIIREIEKDMISPEEAARLKDDTAWENVKRDAREEGKIEGIKEGKIEGIKEGKIEGIKEGEVKGKIEATLEIRFGTRGLACMETIRELQDLDKLTRIAALAKEAVTIEKFESELGRMA